MPDDSEVSEHNSYVFDPENTTEMSRLIRLDQFTNKAMGGTLPEQPDIASIQRILDVACGAGGWVIDVAFAYPHIEVAGIDISQIMISYANARARSQNIHNASFGVMDIRQPLDLSDHSFDLVNARFHIGVLSRKAWPLLLQEYVRILRPGGIIRLTEGDNIGFTNSPAFEQLNDLFFRTLHQMGYGFSANGRNVGMTFALEHLLRQAGCQNVQSKGHAINFSAGTESWPDFYRTADIVFKAGQPLIIQAGLAIQEELDQLYQQMLIEMHAEDFCGVWFFLTSWGTLPAQPTTN